MLTLISESLAARLALSLLFSSTALATMPSGVDTRFAEIPNVTIVQYDVTGGNTAAVRRSIDKVRPTDPNDGTRVDGLSHYDFRWRWHDNGQGKCTTTPDDILFSATVTVPRLVDGDAKLRERFDRYLSSLLEHEDGHIRYAWDHRADIATAISSATCATANAAAQNALKAISAHDIAYDKATRHGATTIVPFN